MFLKINIFFVQSIIVYNQCFLSNAKPIIGANVRSAQVDEFNFVASFMRREDGKSHAKQFCTGALITLRDILTAEHCFEGEDQESIFVIAESIDLRCGKKYHILWWISYDQWTARLGRQIESAENDIAITRLHENVRNVRPGVFSNLLGSDFDGFDVTIVGWGISNSGSHPNVLELTNVKVLNLKKCKTLIEKITKKKINISQNFMCTISKPYGLIQAGDSGGPLIFRGTIIAINRSICPASVGSDHSLKVNLHLSLDKYRTFITDTKLNY